MAFRSEFMNTLHERGFVHQCTDPVALDAAMAAGPVTAYIGFDATADSLHTGHLLHLMSLRWLQRLGHRPIVLIGGGTTRVGDPSFRDSTRPMLDDDAIVANSDGLRATFERFLDLGGAGGGLMLDNDAWLEPLRFVAFLREVGVHFSVNRMMAMDSVRQRLDREQSLTLLEFNYMVLQSFDFLHLARTEGCVLQMGGSDQWGNIVNGIDLARRMEGRSLFGLTTPLLTTASGGKMGKSANGAVWLSRDRLSPFDLWQWWRNVDDADTGRFIRLFTEMPLGEADRLGALRGAEANEAKVALADAVVGLVHGDEAARAAREAASGSAGDGIPVVEVRHAEITSGAPLAGLLVRAGLARSGNQARDLIAGGGARVNGRVVTDPFAVLEPGDVRDGTVRMGSGRKRVVALVGMG